MSAENDAERERLGERALHAIEAYGRHTVLMRDVEAAEAVGWRLGDAIWGLLDCGLPPVWVAERVPEGASDCDLVRAIGSIAHRAHTRADKEAVVRLSCRLTPAGFERVRAARTPALTSTLCLRLALFERTGARREWAGMLRGGGWVADYAGLLARGQLTGTAAWLDAAGPALGLPIRAVVAARTGLARRAISRRRIRLDYAATYRADVSYIANELRWMDTLSPPDAAAREFLRRRRADARRNLAGFARWRVAVLAATPSAGPVRDPARVVLYAGIRA